MPVTKLQPSQVKRITIKDVALKAGVSITTVSNLLNGRVDAMTEETKERIQEAIRTLNYRPNRVARSLVTNHTATIGLILAEIETPLFLQATNFIEPIARNAGYNILFGNARNPEDEQNVVNLLLEKQVDGIIFLTTSIYHEQDYLAHLPSSAPPIVLVNRATNLNRFDQINWDNTSGVTHAVDYLVQLGHRRIAHLHGPLNRRSTEERLRGFQAGLEQNGLPYDEAYVRPGDYAATQAAWQQSTCELLSLPLPPTAMIAADDIVAATVMRTIQREGLRVPEDVAVIGIDDQPFFCTYLNPALTTIQLPVVEAGKLAIEMLLRRIAGERSTVEQVLLPCPLVIRESCGTYLKGVVRA